MDASGEAVLVLTPTQEQAMLARLQKKNITITKIRFVFHSFCDYIYLRKINGGKGLVDFLM